MKYIVELVHKGYRDFEIEAESKGEAEEIAMKEIEQEGENLELWSLNEIWEDKNE
jgi:hypothetical protein